MGAPQYKATVILFAVHCTHCWRINTNSEQYKSAIFVYKEAAHAAQTAASTADNVWQLRRTSILHYLQFRSLVPWYSRLLSVVICI